MRFWKFGYFETLPMMMVLDNENNCITIIYRTTSLLVFGDKQAKAKVGDLVLVPHISVRYITKKPSVKAVLTVHAPLIILNNENIDVEKDTNYILKEDYSTLDWCELHDTVPVITTNQAIDLIFGKTIDVACGWNHRRIKRVRVNVGESIFTITDKEGRDIFVAFQEKNCVIDAKSGEPRPLLPDDIVKYRIKLSLVPCQGMILRVDGFDNAGKSLFENRSARNQFLRNDTKYILDQSKLNQYDVIVSRWTRDDYMGFVAEKFFLS